VVEHYSPAYNEDLFMPHPNLSHPAAMSKALRSSIESVDA